MIDRIAPRHADASGEGGCAKCNLQNGADGISDIEGKIARVATREWSRGAVSDMDGQTERSK